MAFLQKESVLKNKVKVFVYSFILLSIITIGVISRLRHIFGFFIYPDSYYYLLLADNLNKHSSLFGRLGPKGMGFPPLGYASYKPIFPLFVAIADRLVKNLEFSGHFVVIVASVASIIITYLLLRNLFQSELAGSCGAILLATSYNHIFWSGFIVGDTLSVFFIMTSFLFSFRKRQESYGNFTDFFAGTLLSFSILSKPTYIVILPALFLLMSKEFDWRKKRFLTFISGFLLTSSLLVFLLFPPPYMILKIASNLSKILLVVMLFMFIAVTVLIVREKRIQSKIMIWLGYVSKGVFVLLVSLPVFIYLANVILFPLLGQRFYLGFHRFVERDPILAVLYLIGLCLLLFSSKRNLGLFCAANIAFLLVLYFQVETWESRYLIHLMPFLVMAASFGFMRSIYFFVEVYRKNSKWAKASVSIILIFVTMIFWPYFLRVISPSSNKHLKTSYVREVARKASVSLSKYSKNDIVIAALPWPYYFHLRFSTWGIDESQTNKALKYLPDDGHFLLISDLAMRYHFPRVAKKAKINYKEYIITKFSVGIPYQYAYFSVPEEHEVLIYRLSKDQLYSIF